MKILLLLLFWSLWYLNFSSRIIIPPLLPLIEEEFAVSHARAGSLFFFLSIGYAISLFMAWLLPSRVGYKKSIIWSYVLLAVSIFFLKYAETYISFAFFLFFVGLGSGLYVSCAVPLITSIFSEKNWGKAIAFHETAASFSALTIPILTVFAMQFIAWRNLFPILGAAVLIVNAALWFFGPDTRPQNQYRVKLSSLFLRRDFWVITALWIVAGMSTAGVFSITPLYLVNERGMLLETANRVFGYSRIGGLFATLLIGVVLDRFGVKKILLVTLLATGISSIGLAVAQKFWHLTGMLFFQGTVTFAFFPVGFLAISRVTDQNNRSVFTGLTVGITVLFAMGLTPVMLGAVADVWNFQIGILAIGIITLISSVLIKGLDDI